MYNKGDRRHKGCYLSAASCTIADMVHAKSGMATKRKPCKLSPCKQESIAGAKMSTHHAEKLLCSS